MSNSVFFGIKAKNYSFLAKEGALTELYRQYGKRQLDILLCLVFLPIFLPVIVVLWILVRCEGGPGFFGHERVGLHGKRFKCWKMRTMVVDAEAKLQKLLAESPEAAADWAKNQKLDNDPRINKLGHFLRKTSLDELPQIWNVLKGEMSWVGPRPVVADELTKYGTKVESYLAQKPGITGLWQVSGRNNTTYDERVDMDVTYFKQRGMFVDLGIVTKTAFSVIRLTGR